MYACIYISVYIYIYQLNKTISFNDTNIVYDIDLESVGQKLLVLLKRRVCIVIIYERMDIS